MLPVSIRIIDIQYAADDFHARFSAIGKHYRYTLFTGRIHPPSKRLYSMHIRDRLNLERMQGCLRQLEGTHDFRSFEAVGAERRTSVRTVSELSVSRRRGAPQGLLEIDVAADGFLYNMVRIFVGTLVEVGKGKQPAGWVRRALKAARRDAAGPTAPPEGLFLMEVRCRQ